jgi:ABC-2 type transport system ATP-binding protein
LKYAVTCAGLTKTFKDFVALDGVDLQVPSGSIFGFLGQNGAGKTTLIRLLTGLDRPTSGQATVLGKSIGASSELSRHRIGYLDQQPQFYNWMTGRETVDFIGSLFGLKRNELSSRSERVLEETGLTSAANRKVGGYSGGMKQRLGIAQALINDPDLLFLDEPASALDPAGRRDILDIIDRLRGKVTVFMSTHILADVERVCDRVAIIDHGRILVEETLESLQLQYVRPVFVLDPETGQDIKVAALVESLKAKSWCSRITIEGGEIRIDVSEGSDAGIEILPMVAASGVRLASFRHDRPSLEEIFLQLVGEDTSASLEAHI